MRRAGVLGQKPEEPEGCGRHPAFTDPFPPLHFLVTESRTFTISEKAVKK